MNRMTDEEKSAARMTKGGIPFRAVPSCSTRRRPGGRRLGECPDRRRTEANFRFPGLEILDLQRDVFGLAASEDLPVRRRVRLSRGRDRAVHHRPRRAEDFRRDEDAVAAAGRAGGRRTRRPALAAGQDRRFSFDQSRCRRPPRDGGVSRRVGTILPRSGRQGHGLRLAQAAESAAGRQPRGRHEVRCRSLADGDADAGRVGGDRRLGTAIAADNQLHDHGGRGGGTGRTGGFAELPPAVGLPGDELGIACPPRT